MFFRRCYFSWTPTIWPPAVLGLTNDVARKPDTFPTSLPANGRHRTVCIHDMRRCTCPSRRASRLGEVTIVRSATICEMCVYVASFDRSSCAGKKLRSRSKETKRSLTEGGGLSRTPCEGLPKTMTMTILMKRTAADNCMRRPRRRRASVRCVRK
jgi:hypothetical protein